MTNVIEFRRTDDAELLRPLLGEIARQWKRIHPHDLTVAEALQLLTLLCGITDRLDAEAGGAR